MISRKCNCITDFPIAQSAIFSMGTVITSQLFGNHAAAALSAAESKIRQINGRLSRFDNDSEISLLNRMAGIAPVCISEETFHLLKNAKAYTRMSEGLFDITVGPLVSLWSTYRANRLFPVPEAVQEQLAYIDGRGIFLDEQNRMAALSRKGQMIDLGGIGKGYASDKISEMFRHCGIRSGYTDFGGNVAVIGTKPDGSDWKIGIRHPRKRDALIGVISIKDRSVVTSGDDQRYFCDHDGNRYHHILDPRTGYPSDSGLFSVTVIADSGEVADALSTTLFIAGEDKSKEILRHFTNVDAIYVRKDGSITLSPGAIGCFTVADGITVVAYDAKRGVSNFNA